jgi:hypothetical protein
MRNLRDSDFGIFVFGPDDVANIRGDFLNAPRDNVVYEAGLFSGYLGPERCFIAVPQTVPVRIPTDLLGMTHGYYEDNRSDGNEEAAVNSFCFKVEKQIPRGFCDRGTNCEVRDPRGDPGNRVDKKRKVAAEIKSFCAAHSIDYIPLFCAIICRPEEGDGFTNRPSLSVPRIRPLRCCEAIKAKGCCNVQPRSLTA